MVGLVGPVVKPFGTTVQKEVRKKVEEILTRVYKGYVPPWSLVEEGIAPRRHSVTSRVAIFESGDGGGHRRPAYDAIVAICLIFPRVTFNPLMFQKHQFGQCSASR